MWIWSSSVLLATFVVSSLSFPHPDKEYQIPEVGTGQRSQYYVLHRDGTYKYGFDTGDGAFESVKAMTLGNVNGNFGYIDPDGRQIRLEYEAGEGGFVARGDHLPKPSDELARALATVVGRSEPFIDPLAGAGGDRSYGFKFDGEEHSRNEQADKDGTITGSYSYVDEDGIKRSFTYRAGKGIGFVIEGDGLTQDVNTQTSQRGTVRQAQTHQRSRTSTSNFQAPSRNVGSSFRQATTFTGVQPQIVSSRSQDVGDASYSFKYDAGDHSRSETSDDDLNINGRFSFVADDGNRRTVDYNAGSGTGFVATGEHLPKAPEEFGSRITSSGASFRQSQHSSRASSSPSKKPVRTFSQQSYDTTRNTGATSGTGISDFNNQQQQFHSSRASSSPRRRPATSVTQRHGSTRNTVSTSDTDSSNLNNQQLQSHSSRASSAGFRSPSSKYNQNRRTSATANFGHQRRESPVVKTTFTSGQQPQRSYEEANIRSSSSPDGGYQFSYRTHTHSRTETGDADNNVDGHFDFIGEDDQKGREINYEAGSDTGFIAKGNHIPVGPEVPGARSGQPTGDIEEVEVVNYVDPMSGWDTDQSYNFGFESDSYSRSETADEHGNIVGTYSVVDDDGLKITYRFRSGKGIGFEIEEIDREQGQKPVKPTPYSGPLAIEEAAPFDVPGTPTFPSPGQSNYVHPHPTGTSSTSFSGSSSSHGVRSGQRGTFSRQRGNVNEQSFGNRYRTDHSSSSATIPAIGSSVIATPRRAGTSNVGQKFGVDSSDVFSNLRSQLDTQPARTGSQQQSGSFRTGTHSSSGNVGSHGGTGSITHTSQRGGTSHFSSGSNVRGHGSGQTTGTRKTGAHFGAERGGAHGSTNFISNINLKSPPGTGTSGGQVATAHRSNFRTGSSGSFSHGGNVGATQSRSKTEGRGYQSGYYPTASQRDGSSRFSSSSNVRSRGSGLTSGITKTGAHIGAQREGAHGTGTSGGQVATSHRANFRTGSFSHGGHVGTGQTRSKTDGSRFGPQKVNLRSAFTPSHTHQVFPGFTLHKYEPSLSAEKFGYVLKFN